jgi:hypothetical protein
MLLGYSSHKAPIGLVLIELGLDLFERVGYFESPDLCDPDPRLNEYLQGTSKREIVIV